MQKPESIYPVSLVEKKNSGEFLLVSLKKNRGTKIFLFRCFAVLLFSNALMIMIMIMVTGVK